MKKSSKFAIAAKKLVLGHVEAYEKVSIPILEIFNQIPVGHCDFNTTSPELHKATLELVWLDLFLICF